MASEVEVLTYDTNTGWVLQGATLVFFMQSGFALLEVGVTRSKATRNILLKNVLDATIGALIWYSVGFAFAYGETGRSSNAFIGSRDFFLIDVQGRNTPGTDDRSIYAEWLFSWAFAATAATIVSGAVAERCKFVAYMTYTAFITGFIYPCVVHWVWSSKGWMSPRIDREKMELDPLFSETNGLMDFAGSGVVHMVGGALALCAAMSIGPRMGRFSPDGSVVAMPGHSSVFFTLGVLILWLSWYGFNMSSTLALVPELSTLAAKIAVNTTLAASSCGLGVLLIHVSYGFAPDVAPALSGILAGLVSITAGCAYVEPYAAIVIGAVAAPTYYYASVLLKKLRIDDPVDAAPVHLASGVWGLLAVGALATEGNTRMALRGIQPNAWGFLYGGGGEQLGMQVLGVVVILAWTLLCGCVLFPAMSRLGLLRISMDEEVDGMDLSCQFGYEGAGSFSNRRFPEPTPMGSMKGALPIDVGASLKGGNHFAGGNARPDRNPPQDGTSNGLDGPVSSPRGDGALVEQPPPTDAAPPA